MTYEEFKFVWEQAVRDSGLRLFGLAAEETLDLRAMGRVYEVFLEPAEGQDAEPFNVTAKLSWRWDALQSARTRSTEEDLLAEILGAADATRDTERPWLRVDVTLCATLPWGKPLPMPKAAVWAKWAHEVTTRLESIEPVVPEEVVRETEGGDLEFLAWQGEPEAKFLCGPDGELKLERVEIASWQSIELPRKWDDTDREPDEPPHQQLREMFARVKAALHAWMEITDHLRHAGR